MTMSENERLPTPVGNRGVHPGHYRRQAVSGNNVGKPWVIAIVDGCCSATRGSPPPTRTPTTRSTPCCGPVSRGTTSTSIPPAAPGPAGPSSTWPSSCSAPATPSRSPAWTGSAAPAAEVRQGRGQPRPVGLAAGDLVLEELDAPGFAQRVELQLRPGTPERVAGRQLG